MNWTRYIVKFPRFGNTSGEIIGYGYYVSIMKPLMDKEFAALYKSKTSAKKVAGKNGVVETIIFGE